MPYCVTYTEKPLGVKTQFYGVVTDQELKESVVERLSRPEVFAELRYIFDDFFEASAFDVTPSGMLDCAQTLLAGARLELDIVHAAVVPSELMYGMGRIWQGYTTETGWQSKIVRSHDEAIAWFEENNCQLANEICRPQLSSTSD